MLKYIGRYRNFWQPIGESAHALKGPWFFWGAGWGERGRELGFCYSQRVPLPSSQLVPNMLPMFSMSEPPTCSKLHLTLSHMLCQNIVFLKILKLYRWENIETYIFYEYFYINKCPTFQKIYMMGQSKKFMEFLFFLLNNQYIAFDIFIHIFYIFNIMCSLRAWMVVTSIY
jgi:hypothetical protein